jgi:hypothetical protein
MFGCYLRSTDAGGSVRGRLTIDGGHHQNRFFCRRLITAPSTNIWINAGNKCFSLVIISPPKLPNEKTPQVTPRSTRKSASFRDSYLNVMFLSLNNNFHKLAKGITNQEKLQQHRLHQKMLHTDTLGFRKKETSMNFYKFKNT